MVFLVRSWAAVDGLRYPSRKTPIIKNLVVSLVQRWAAVDGLPSPDRKNPIRYTQCAPKYRCHGYIFLPTQVKDRKNLEDTKDKDVDGAQKIH